MHRVGAAEQVVEIAHHLLVRPPQEHADPVGLAVVERVQFQKGFIGPTVDEARQLAVGIAGEVGELPKLAGAFIEAMDRHHRKQLIDRPGIRCGAEDREVGVIGPGQCALRGRADPRGSVRCEAGVR